MDKGFYSADLFTEFRQLQQEAFQNQFDVHRLTLEVEHLRAENMRLEVAKAMAEPEYMTEIKQRHEQEDYMANFIPELGATA
jgi:hypothetical protein